MGCGQSSRVDSYVDNDFDRPMKEDVKSQSFKQGSPSNNKKQNQKQKTQTSVPNQSLQEDEPHNEDYDIEKFLRETDDIGLAPRDKEEEAQVDKMEKAILSEMAEASRNFALLKGTRSHQKPPMDEECACCCIELDFMNYVEYQYQKGGLWYPSSYCEQCLEKMLQTGWDGFKELLRNAKCEAVVRRLLFRLPRRIYDKIALPCPDNKEVYLLWYSSDQEEHSAMLHGAPTGKDRENFINHMKSFAEAMSVAKKAAEAEQLQEQRTKDELAHRYGYEDDPARARRKERERRREEQRMEDLMSQMGYGQ